MDINVLLIFLFTLFSFQSSVESVKCFTCAFSINRCTDLNCYNSPDNCSPKFFTAAVVPYRECPTGCEMFSISDANGLVLEWKRDCDRSGNTAGSAIDFTSKCKTEYVFGTRMDKCFCNQDYCNSTVTIKPDLLQSLIVILLITIYTNYY